MMDIDLKQVFTILDENDEGQIQLRRFVDVANNYYSDAEVSFRLSLKSNVNPLTNNKDRHIKNVKIMDFLRVRWAYMCVARHFICTSQT
jgi:hypothetical protein